MLQQMNCLRKGSNVVVWTDNTATESVLLKRKSGDTEVNKEWKVIQEYLIDKEIELTARRVKSGDNLANGLSRGLLGALKKGNRVYLPIPIQWENYLHHA
jgi:hypothetical protein